jgi:hypothetical protein
MLKGRIGWIKEEEGGLDRSKHATGSGPTRLIGGWGNLLTEPYFAQLYIIE